MGVKNPKTVESAKKHAFFSVKKSKQKNRESPIFQKTNTPKKNL